MCLWKEALSCTHIWSRCRFCYIRNENSLNTLCKCTQYCDIIYVIDSIDFVKVLYYTNYIRDHCLYIAISDVCFSFSYLYNLCVFNVYGPRHINVLWFVDIILTLMIFMAQYYSFCFELMTYKLNVFFNIETIQIKIKLL